MGTVNTGVRTPSPQPADRPDVPLFTVPIVGTWGIGGECIEPQEGCLRVGLFGSVPGRKTVPAAQASAERAFASVLRAPAIDPGTVLRAAAGEVDIALRRDFSPTQPEGTGTVALAHLDDKGVLFAWTATGSAYRVRRGQATLVLEGDAGTQQPIDPQIGGRARIDTQPALFVGRPDWQLLPGDRILLSTRRLSKWFDDVALSELALQDSCEGAAQALSAMAGVRSGGQEIPVAVIEIAVGDTQAELDDTGTAYDELLDSLATVIPDLIAANERARLQERAAATEGFAPVREATPWSEPDTMDPLPSTSFAERSSPAVRARRATPERPVERPVSAPERDADTVRTVETPSMGSAVLPAQASPSTPMAPAPQIPAWVVAAAVLMMICGVIVGLFAL